MLWQTNRQTEIDTPIASRFTFEWKLKKRIRLRKPNLLIDNLNKVVNKAVFITHGVA